MRGMGLDARGVGAVAALDDLPLIVLGVANVVVTRVFTTLGFTLGQIWHGK